jgi:hypothetical protein
MFFCVISQLRLLSHNKPGKSSVLSFIEAEKYEMFFNSALTNLKSQAFFESAFDEVPLFFQSFLYLGEVPGKFMGQFQYAEEELKMFEYKNNSIDSNNLCIYPKKYTNSCE